jgi:hypothetical protein
MSSVITRPIFFEGQRLAATDLDQVVDYGRAKRERHDRFVHRWGIVTGLTLTLEAAADGRTQRLFVEPGVAIDGEGREILIGERKELDAARLKQVQGGALADDTFYPVFLRSQYKAQPPSGGLVGCTQTGNSRVVEGDDVEFGRVGSEVGWEDQTPSTLATTPTAGEGGGAWRILLGFVQWDTSKDTFAAAETQNDTGVGRRYVGVNADVVAGHAGKVTVQTQDAAVVGTPMLQLSEEGGGQLCFGLYNGPGELKKLLTIASNGDVKAEGALTGRSMTGGVQLQSGIATDGVVLPLPPGITQEQIDDGAATLYIQVSPRIDPSQAPDTTGNWAALVQECRVDAERRVRCRICWFDLDFTGGGANGTHLTLRPGSCDFLLLATSMEEASS